MSYTSYLANVAVMYTSECYVHVHITPSCNLPSGEAGPELKMDFLKEISTMKKISMGRCPHVVNMIGCCTLQEPLALVLEYAAYGDLLEYLRTIRQRVSACSILHPCL